MQATARAQKWNAPQSDTMKVADRLDSGTSPDLETDVKLLLVSGTMDLTLDCANLNYMTATGLHTLINMAKEMQKAGGKLMVANLQGQPKEIFDACYMGQTIPDAGYLNEAVANLVA